jgi:hypothetical protein
MVTKGFVKTAIAGLHAWILNKFKITEPELLHLLAEIDCVQPVASASGEIYTSNSGKVYIL